MKRIMFLVITTLLVNNLLTAQCLSGDCENSKSTYLFQSGAKYVGDFLEGQMNGFGVLYYPDGKRYVGYWEASKQHGEGAMFYADGRIEKGEWQHGAYQGLELPVREIKEEFAEKGSCLGGDCYNGIGIYQYNEGHIFEGNFVQGIPHGFGVYYIENGDTALGYWNKGRFLGSLRDDASGCLVGDCLSGIGFYITTSKDIYMGNFKNGIFEGFGVCTFANGDKYTGSWKSGTFDGMGTLYRHNGEVYGGSWAAGQFSNSKLKVRDDSPVVFDKEIKVWAVVVGVARYNHMPTLNYTDDDAYRIAMFLKSPEGGALPEEQIAILIDEDATRDNILDAMRNTFSKADSNDVVMLYFSGHGLQGMFLPTDFDGVANKIRHSEIKDIVEQSKAKHKVCIADACHSGSLQGFTMKTANSKATIQSYYDAFDEVKGGTALLLSSKAEETSLESSGLRQGIFSHFLIRGLKGEADQNGNNIITIKELHQFIHDNVRSYTGNLQTPVLQGNFDESMPLGVVRK